MTVSKALIQMPKVFEWTCQVSHQFQQLAPRRDLQPQQQAPQPRQRQGEPVVEAKLCWYLAKPNQPRWERLVETTWVESLKKGALVGGKTGKVTERENFN